MRRGLYHERFCLIECMKGGESDGMREKPQRRLWIKKDHEEKNSKEKIGK